MATDQETTRVGRRKCPSCGLELASSVTVCPRDGTPVQTSIDIDPAFANYEFLASIGEGGMGVIYKARHRHLNKIVAIKTLHSHLTNPELIRRFHIEGKAASILSHPNIIAVQDFGLTKSGQPYMIMDYVDGQTLSDGLRQFGQLPMHQFLPIFLQVCDALSHAHKRAVLHRDVKPSNIMLIRNSKNGFDIRIMDFGIAKLMNESEAGGQNLTKTGDAIGSPIYMSPEQARGGKMDHRSDLYSLGCVMYEGLTGSPPFCGNTALDTMMMHIEKKPMPLSQASMGMKVDHRLEQVIMRLLEKEPVDRYQSMDDLREDLIALQNPDATKVLPSIRDSQLVTRAQAKIGFKTKSALAEKLPLVATISGALVLTFGCIGLLFWKSPHTEQPANTSVFANNKKETTHATKKAPVSSTTSAIKTSKPNEEKDTDITALNNVLPDLGTLKQALKDQVSENSPRITLGTSAAFHGTLTDADMSIMKKATLAKIINLKGLPISDKGFDNIKDLKHVELLDVSATKARTLKFISNLMTLQFFYANNLDLLPEAYEHIGNLTNLTELNIGYSPVTDADLPKLYKLRNLRLVGLESCDNLTQLGIDQFRNQLPGCEIKETSVWDKKANSTEMFKKAQALEKTDDWTGANKQISEALKIISAENINSDIKANANVLKGDCQFHFKLFKNAELFYSAGIKSLYLTYVDDPRMPSFYDKLATVYESSKDSAEAIQQAINTREKSEDQFQRMEKTPTATSAIKDWMSQRSANLEKLAIDYMQFHQNAKAASIITELIKNCDPANSERKRRYQKLLATAGHSK